VYRAYTDATFRQPDTRPERERHLGLLGPVIRAEVGDTIEIVFRNSCPFPTSFHPHGLWSPDDSEAAGGVPPGGTQTYVWKVPEWAGPGPDDGSSAVWTYRSHTNDVTDTYAGLMGPIVITRQGMARPDGSPRDVGREVFALLSVMNENRSPLLEENVHRFGKRPYPKDLDDDEFVESNLMHSINGYVFGSQPMIRMRKGEHVRWYVMSMGTEVDLQASRWRGNEVTVSGMRMDAVSPLQTSTVVADMVPDNPGIWLFHSHTDHVDAGMVTSYEVVD
jgi:FtsP/CotA-like multicopper oxidase with cupredoxin domain